MISFLRKNKVKDMNIYSPVDGFCTDISKCSDPVFANKMMGDGFIVNPTSDIVRSVCEGIVTMIFPSKHAVGLTMDNGQEIMIHIGIDTVRLNGKGFDQLVKVNDHVRIGKPLVKLDMEYLKKQDFDLSVLVIMTNDIKVPYKKICLNDMVKAQAKIVKRE